jgi:hypothetical protein
MSDRNRRAWGRLVTLPNVGSGRASLIRRSHSMNPVARYRLAHRWRRIHHQLQAEIASPVADLAVVRRLKLRAREAAFALASVAA